MPVAAVMADEPMSIPVGSLGRGKADLGPSDISYDCVNVSFITHRRRCEVDTL